MQNNTKDSTQAIAKKSYTIGKTTYHVSMHFSQTSTENMEDKIKRLIEYDQKQQMN